MPPTLRDVFRFRRDERGATAIEAALVFPFMVVLMAGLFEFGSLFYNHELIQTGVRDAARYLARVPDRIGSEGAARNLAVNGSASGGTARVKWWQPGDVEIAYRVTPNPVDPTTGLRPYRGGDPITVVHVGTAITYPGFGLLHALGLGPVRVTAAHEERYVGE